MNQETSYYSGNFNKRHSNIFIAANNNRSLEFNGRNENISDIKRENLILKVENRCLKENLDLPVIYAGEFIKYSNEFTSFLHPEIGLILVDLTKYSERDKEKIASIINSSLSCL